MVDKIKSLVFRWLKTKFTLLFPSIIMVGGLVRSSCLE